MQSILNRKHVLSAALCALLGTPALAEVDKLSIHGFFTQAWARANYVDGLTSPALEEVALGIPDGDSTTNYRIGALQFRYEMSEKSRMIVQLSTRALGDNPIDQVEDEIELDWAFYEYRITDVSHLRVGRIQIPFGLFNEIRDVGTVLPFYRPPVEIYGEGTYTSETVDGLLVDHELLFNQGWGLSVAGYFGELETFESSSFIAQQPPFVARASDVIGAQLWLRTPVEGLRFGVAATWLTLAEGSPFIRATDEEQDARQWIVSAELDLDQWVIRGELKRFEYDETSIAPSIEDEGAYLQIGWRATERLHLYVQAEQGSNEFGTNNDLFATETSSYGVAVNIRFQPSVVLKLEHHFDIELDSIEIDPTEVLGFARRQGTGGDYSIGSLSVSF